MDNKQQTADAAAQSRSAAASREPASPGPQMCAAPASSKDARMSEPPVATDGQLVEAGYGHGV